MINRLMTPRQLGTERLHKVKLPIYISPKLNGIRFYNHPIKGLVNKKLKRFNNKELQYLFTKLKYLNIEGEIIHKDIFHFNSYKNTYDIVNNNKSIKDLLFYIHDRVILNKQFKDRLDSIKDITNNSIRIIKQTYIDNADKLYQITNKYIEDGYEGSIIKKFDGYYKEGKSYYTDSLMLKIEENPILYGTLKKIIIINKNISLKVIYRKKEYIINYNIDNNDLVYLDKVINLNRRIRFYLDNNKYIFKGITI